MALVDGINHVAFITRDFDRLADFYRRVFDAEVVLDVNDARGLRHGMIQIGATCVLHAFEMADSPQAEPGQQMFERGRLDHIAINAASKDAFQALRERLIEAGASDGTITDFGAILSVFFRDPDGMEAEMCVMKEGVSMSETRPPEGWVPPPLRDRD
jgi:catechol 2,3-dioxygenase-like lactoylglutathione lyase family enzyme